MRDALMRTVSAETYRERILHELRIEESKARARITQLINIGGEDPKTGETYEGADHFADGLHAAYMVVRRISTRAAYKTKPSS
jgi:hypothetical protein